MTNLDREMEINIHALVDGELDESTAHEVEARIAANPALAAQRDAIAALKRKVGGMPRPTPSDALLAKISAIGRSPAHALSPTVIEPDFGRQKRLVPRTYGWQALAASVVLTAFLTGTVTRVVMLGSAQDRFVSAIADDHRRSLLAASPFDVASSDRHTVKPWLDSKLGLSPPAPDLASQGFSLAGGRVEVISNRPLPALIYRHHEHLITVVADPLQGGSPSEPVDLSAGGFSMVKWSDGAFVFWAISDTEWADLNNFVSQFRAAAMAK